MTTTSTKTNRTIFLIPEAHMPRLEREIAKLSKKAQKWHDWSFEALIIGFKFRDEPNGTKTKLLEVCLDVETIKIDGWEFVARIDHSNDTGNVLRVVPNVGVAIENRFRTAAPNCQHCNHNRKRRDTFVLHNAETNEFKQVGSTCLEEFLGHDAANLGRIAEYAGYANELARAIEAEPTDPRALNDHRYIALSEYLVHCAAMVRTQGWVSGKAAFENPALTSTRVAALENMMDRRHVVSATDEDRLLASKALAWAQSFSEKTDLNDYEHNVQVISEAVVIEGRSCGLAASIVGVYFTKNTPKRGSTDMGDLTPLLALFAKAGSHLKHPKINLDIPGTGPVVITVAGDRAKNPGTINIASPGSFGENTWYGRIGLDGSYTPSRQAPVGIEQGLMAFAADPLAVLADHGHRTGRCGCCNRALTDQRSVTLGVGPICAERWALDWKGAMKVAA